MASIERPGRGANSQVAERIWDAWIDKLKHPDKSSGDGDPPA